MKFIVITALFLVASAAGAPTEHGTDPLEGSYSAPQTLVQGSADDTTKMERQPVAVKIAIGFVDSPGTQHNILLPRIF
ncbi:hypothetical protein EG327_007868 [Venturia inaequalis]|uniref:Secreted protein n=1 Tax=Venturia inaequalis TaxID=5025 RepID=A0A8H3UTT2_VENIN|nr:hypothetical protein EG327_007868 [Venturia inaequalis]